MSAALLVSERTGPQITTQPLPVGCLIFPQMDQIDFTGPFEVLSRMPETAVHVVGKELAPVRGVQGLQLTPDVSIAEARIFDVLLVPGGCGQQPLMQDEVLWLIRKQVQAERILFSVCTGALLCGAAGVFSGRHVTTHWAARSLRSYYDAVLADARVGRGRQHHQRCWRHSRLGCGSGTCISPERGGCCSGDSARHRVCTEPRIP
ncbi:MAG TPA: DJ-1/PfpI family protein [Acidobacteriaceae bacterium]